MEKSLIFSYITLLENCQFSSSYELALGSIILSCEHFNYEGLFINLL